MRIKAFALTIAGCPYWFSTGGLASSPTSSDAAWTLTGRTHADGFLVWPENEIREEARPLDGDLDAGSQTFRLHDAPATAGSASGYSLFSYLATRSPSLIRGASLSANITAAALAMTVSSAVAMPGSWPAVLWVDQEAMLCSGLVGATVTITTRGYLGTVATTHVIDQATGTYPEVFTSFPWTTRRRVHLWGIDEDLVARRLWTGYCSRAPRLAEGAPAIFELECEHVWTLYRDTPTGDDSVSIPLVGCGAGQVAAADLTSASPEPALVEARASLLDALSGTPTDTGLVRAPGIYTSIRAALDRLGAALAAHAQIAAGTPSVRVSQPAPGAYQLEFTTHNVGHTLRLAIGTKTVTAAPFTRAGVNSNTTSVVTIEGLPQVYYNWQLGMARQSQWYVASKQNAPTSWSATTTTEGAYQTISEPALRTEINDDWHFLLTDVVDQDPSVPVAPAPNVQLPAYQGTVRVARRRASARGWTSDDCYFSDPQPLRLVYGITSNFWAHGVRRGVLPYTQEADTNDWDWTTLDSIARASDMSSAARNWTLDGTRTFGSLVTEACLLEGCSPVVRAGKLALWRWRQPLASDTVALAITSASILGTPTWGFWVDGYANTVQVKSDALEINVTNRRSLARYGAGRPIQIDMAGIDAERLGAMDPMQLARDVMSRLGMWSEPHAAVRVRVSLEQAFTVYLGDIVTVTDWVLPDGTGDRGMSAVRCLVVGRTLRLGREGEMELEAIAYPDAGAGYSPCVRVASLTGLRTLVVSPTPVGGSDDYSGSAAGAGYAVDGYGGFAADDLVELIVRDSTTDTRQSAVIVSVTWNAGTSRWEILIDRDASAAIQAAIPSGYTDLRFDAYAVGMASRQKAYAWIGSATAGTINSTTDLVQPMTA